MSYAAAYCLFNYTLDNRPRGMEYSNLRLIRAFEQGLNPKSSEAGFVLTHVDMVKESPALIDATVRILNTLEREADREEVNDGLREILRAMEKVEACMEGTFSCPTRGQKGVFSRYYPKKSGGEQLLIHRRLGMWKNSKPSEYLSFRVFIFGITSQSMFPNGVVYEGINDNKPMFFRGESGANDSMVRAFRSTSSPSSLKHEAQA